MWSCTYLSSFSTLVSFFPASLSSATTSLDTAASRFSEILRDRWGGGSRKEERGEEERKKEGKRGVIGEGKKGGGKVKGEREDGGEGREDGGERRVERGKVKGIHVRSTC